MSISEANIDAKVDIINGQCDTLQRILDTTFKIVSFLNTQSPDTEFHLALMLAKSELVGYMGHIVTIRKNVERLRNEALGIDELPF